MKSVSPLGACFSTATLTLGLLPGALLASGGSGTSGEGGTGVSYVPYDLGYMTIKSVSRGTIHPPTISFQL